ncbi:MAG TPA: hypothetical protein VIE65_09235 [Methylobacter sp.]|jgi:hypothetical protein
MRIPAFFIAALIFVASALSSQSATLTSYISKEGKVVVILNGEIAPGDTDQLQQIIKTANDSGKIVSGIRLNSPGGNLLEGSKLADAFRFAKIASVVPNESTCASACFLAFAAGSDKFASYTASIGVHGASNANGTESVESNAATVAMAKIVKELGVPADIIGRMVVTPPDQMVWLTPNNLRAMGATVTGKPVQNPPADAPTQLPQPAQLPMQAAPPKWDNVVNGAVAASTAQHNGKPLFSRVCQPEFKICSSAVFFTSNDGKDNMVRTTEDANGKIIAREICGFNQFGDVRVCTDFDRGTSRRDMKDANGTWSKIADQ